ncbi:hypothetical protein M8J76_000301 [Diaphorina citri]|nr:hypothetical protein M8J76_000301 [Diaphorina citri]KAI5754130.1 hypothetical protein M8J77_005996 [Diaphorina citri]
MQRIVGGPRNSTLWRHGDHLFRKKRDDKSNIYLECYRKTHALIRENDDSILWVGVHPHSPDLKTLDRILLQVDLKSAAVRSEGHNFSAYQKATGKFGAKYLKKYKFFLYAVF